MDKLRNDRHVSLDVALSASPAAQSHQVGVHQDQPGNLAHVHVQVGKDA
jgi:hypothetical protein